MVETLRLEGKLSGPTKANHIVQAFIKLVFESFQELGIHCPSDRSPSWYTVFPIIWLELFKLHIPSCFLPMHTKLIYVCSSSAFSTCVSFLKQSLTCPCFGALALCKQKGFAKGKCFKRVCIRGW